MQKTTRNVEQMHSGEDPAPPLKHIQVKKIQRADRENPIADLFKKGKKTQRCLYVCGGGGRRGLLESLATPLILISPQKGVGGGIIYWQE